MPPPAAGGVVSIRYPGACAAPDPRSLLSCDKSDQKHTRTYGSGLPVILHGHIEWPRRIVASPDGRYLMFLMILHNVVLHALVSVNQNPPVLCGYPQILPEDFAAAPEMPAGFSGIDTFSGLIRLCRGAHCAPANERAEPRFRRWYAAYLAAAPQRNLPSDPVGSRRSPAHQRRQ